MPTTSSNPTTPPKPMTARASTTPKTPGRPREPILTQSTSTTLRKVKVDTRAGETNLFGYKISAELKMARLQIRMYRTRSGFLPDPCRPDGRKITFFRETQSFILSMLTGYLRTICVAAFEHAKEKRRSWILKPKYFRDINLPKGETYEESFDFTRCASLLEIILQGDPFWEDVSLTASQAKTKISYIRNKRNHCALGHEIRSFSRPTATLMDDSSVIKCIQNSIELVDGFGYGKSYSLSKLLKEVKRCARE
ncbi:hypothetical protein YB2330_002384 [Saitoella coloradoensis]